VALVEGAHRRLGQADRQRDEVLVGAKLDPVDVAEERELVRSRIPI
jgi:hypothetical protein